MSVVRRFYVYVDRTSDGRPFYVGKGMKKRVTNMSPRNSLHENIAKKHGIIRTVEFECLEEQEAFEKERELIRSLKTFARTGWGANLTLGGEGLSGILLTNEHKEAIRAANSHEKSVETRIRMKLAAQRRANDPEWIKKMKDVSVKRWESESYRQKFKEATKGKKRTPEQCKRISEGTKKAMLSKGVSHG